MRTVDEVHSVTVNDADGNFAEITSARLNEDGQDRTKFREEVIRLVGGGEDTGKAFDTAFGQCEAKAGNNSIGQAPFDDGNSYLIITRTLA